jgi:hypothetical protein
MLVFILVTLYVLLALFLIYGLLVNGMRPSKTLAWLLAIVYHVRPEPAEEKAGTTAKEFH